MVSMRPFLFFCVGVFALAAGLNATEPGGKNLHRFASGPAQVSLIELYTSEGCSSCPPADRWLGGLREAPGLWRDFVPVALHVDYWNRLGWPDRFSTRAFTQREYDYAAMWQGDSVYTPCFVRDGAEWRGGHDLAPTGRKVGELTVSYDGAVVRTEFIPAGEKAAARAGYEVHAAILGGGITSTVTAGENRGETLRHYFVALRLAQAALGAELPLAVPPITGVPHHALAVWITRTGELTPLQAAGGWLD
ncbi:MAG: DUF1223 domain-containing protein [Verrucomicrobia bacterium]|nr:DUF1223 domain-containing protein [Verrucomicrobiota bacterium]